MKKSHVNIPVFIPHLGCPNDCVFCDQRTISGVTDFSLTDVRGIIENALATIDGTGRCAEIAFFGGSFTGIDRALMISLLDLAEEYVESGKVSGIRMSTRPDYISDEIISIIGKYTLSEVELGIQSMSDKVLSASRRGHTATDTERACALLKSAGIPFVGQMMTGLPSSTPEDEVYTARRICEMGAAGCRIYPTVVFKNTCLAVMAERGEYTPLTVEEAVERSADVLEVFSENGVKCLRIGLQDSENLHDPDKYYAGPAHPALGELVRGELFRRRMTDAVEKLTDREFVHVKVPVGAVSMAVGAHGANREYLKNKFGIKKLKFTQTECLHGYNVTAERIYGSK
ncbi:MAG: radical SAM protein [Clostridia bacterium]|nr:radical SAM protein [Clostridia bacterium]